MSYSTMAVDYGELSHTVLTEKIVCGLGKAYWIISYWHNVGQKLERKKIKIQLKHTIVIFHHTFHSQTTSVTSISVEALYVLMYTF